MAVRARRVEREGVRGRERRGGGGHLMALCVKLGAQSEELVNEFEMAFPGGHMESSAAGLRAQGGKE